MTSWQTALAYCFGTVPTIGIIVFTAIVTAIAGILIGLYRDVSRVLLLEDYGSVWQQSDPSFPKGRYEESLITPSTAMRIMTVCAAGSATILFSAFGLLVVTRSFAVSTLILMVGGLAIGYVIGHVTFLAARAGMLKLKLVWTPYDLFDSGDFDSRPFPPEKRSFSPEGKR